MSLGSRVTSIVSNMAQTYYKRYTLFEIPKEEDIDRVLKQYDVLRKTAVKVIQALPLPSLVSSVPTSTLYHNPPRIPILTDSVRMAKHISSITKPNESPIPILLFMKDTPYVAYRTLRQRRIMTTTTRSVRRIKSLGS